MSESVIILHKQVISNIVIFFGLTKFLFHWFSPSLALIYLHMAFITYFYDLDHKLIQIIDILLSLLFSLTYLSGLDSSVSASNNLLFYQNPPFSDCIQALWLLFQCCGNDSRKVSMSAKVKFCQKKSQR